MFKAEESLTRCMKCNAPVKDTDAVLDALRVGQEALDKAETVQIYGSVVPYSLGLGFTNINSQIHRRRYS